MARPANKELARRQQFYFWKNYRNNRLQHILPNPFSELETSVGPSAVVPPPLAPVTAPPAGTQTPSPMQFGMGPGSSFIKNEQKQWSRQKKEKSNLLRKGPVLLPSANL